MTEIPFIKVNETTEAQYPRGSGGDPIIVFGKTSQTKELDVIHEFRSYDEAVAEFLGVSEKEEDVPLLMALKDIFEESAIRKVTDNLGLEKVYAMNVGASPASQDWIDAQLYSEVKRDIVCEVYEGISTVAFMNTTGTHLDNIFAGGQYRYACFTHEADATKADILKLTDPAETSYVRHSRIFIKLGKNLAKFAAKMACTPYFTDPARGPYRSMKMKDIEVLSYDDLDDYVSAGIIPDWEHRSPVASSGIVEPVKAVSTAYRLVSDERPVDSLAHIRRNVDFHWRQIDIIAAGELKNNDTATGMEAMKSALEGYLAGQQREGHIVEYMIEILDDYDDPYKMIIKRKVKPVNAIYAIEEDSIIMAPS